MSHLQDQILEFLRASPGDRTKQDIADSLGKNKGTLHHALQGLRRAGMVSARHEGKKVFWDVR
jgi:DNA-binding IclR family transcriptional regulator